MESLDQSRFLQLLAAHGPALVLYARQWTEQSSMGAEDVVQEAFVKLMRQRPVPENPAGWLYRVVRNGAISSARSATRRAKHESSAASEVRPWFTVDVEGFLDANEAAKGLQKISIELREVVVLRIWAGRSFEEISTLIGKSVSTAHRRYEAGLVELRKQLGVSVE